MLIPREMYLLDYYLEIDPLSHKLKLFCQPWALSCESYKQEQEKKQSEGYPILLHSTKELDVFRKKKTQTLQYILPRKQT